MALMVAIHNIFYHNVYGHKIITLCTQLIDKLIVFIALLLFIVKTSLMCEMYGLQTRFMHLILQQVPHCNNPMNTFITY